MQSLSCQGGRTGLLGDLRLFSLLGGGMGVDSGPCLKDTQTARVLWKGRDIQDITVTNCRKREE